MSDEFSVTELPVCSFASSSPHSSLPFSFLPPLSSFSLSLFPLLRSPTLSFFLPTSPPPSSLPSSFLPPLSPLSPLPLSSLFFSLSPHFLPLPLVSQELLNARDSLEKQLHELTVQLGQVEEQRIKALRDMENMRVCGGGGVEV